MKYHNGIAFPDVDDFMWREMKSDATYQSSHLRMALGFVTDFSIGVDCGAHVGLWSRLMSQAFSRVIAAEPSADTFEALTLNMRQFGCDNVELHNVALGAAPGSVSMEMDAKGLSLANTGARFVRPNGTIPLVTIDAWQLPSLGFLKLDVEGSEVAALRGAMETLRRCHPVVLFENKFLWRRFGEAREAPQTLLTGLGYRHLAKASCDEIWGPVQ